MRDRRSWFQEQSRGCAMFSSSMLGGTSTPHLAWPKPSSLYGLTWWFQRVRMFVPVVGSLSEPLWTHVSNGNNQVLKMKAALSAFFPANSLVRAHTQGPCFTRLPWQPGAMEQRIQGQVYLQMRLPWLMHLLSLSGLSQM